nr:hypothetical protein CFP56_57821 [Quercus suber]
MNVGISDWDLSALSELDCQKRLMDPRAPGCTLYKGIGKDGKSRVDSPSGGAADPAASKRGSVDPAISTGVSSSGAKGTYSISWCSAGCLFMPRFAAHVLAAASLAASFRRRCLAEALDFYALSSTASPILAVPLHPLAIPLVFWLKLLCVGFALFWLVYRALQVVQKPLGELATLLGFDVPISPDINLADIKADGAIVHWFVPDKQRQKTSLKFEILLNGTVLDTVPITFNAVTVSGLQPSTYYVVRVGLVNSHDFGSRSQPVRFRTKPASTADFFVAAVENQENDHDGSTEVVPYVHQYRGLKDIVPATVSPATIGREGSLVRKQSLIGRRPSQAPVNPESKPENRANHSTSPDGHETLQQLTAKLDQIRRETEDIERQAKEEEEDELKEREKMVEERDRLRAEVVEKEKANRELKRAINVLERQNTAAQNDRSKHERSLQQKRQERQKFVEDKAKWERETVEMNAEVQRIAQAKSEHLERVEGEKVILREKLTDESTAIRALDDIIREMNADHKKIERAMKNESPSGGSDPEPSLVQQLQQDAEEERQWIAHRTSLQAQYAMSFQALESAKRFYADQQRYLESLRAERRRTEEVSQAPMSSPPPTQERLARKGDSPRSRTAQSGHSSTESTHAAGHPNSQSPLNQSSFAATLQSMPAGFPTAPSPFINLQNGMTLHADTVTDEDRERLTGGAPMSPSAGAEYLPTNLFSEDGEHRSPLNTVQPLPGLGSLPGLPSLPGSQGFHNTHEHHTAGPASPTSASSRSPSVFTSPRENNHGNTVGSPDYFADADRQSVRSNRSNRATSGSGGLAASRFSSMFGIKPRIKPITAEDGPALGKAQSQSMPRADQGLAGIDAASRKRNSSISGSEIILDGASDSHAEPPVASSRKRFALFGRDKSDGWPTNFTSFARRPASPRPGSTHSTELPRPSFDSSRWGVGVGMGDPWPALENSSGTRNSPLGFGQPWNTPSLQQVRLYGSRHQSRRTSVQYGGPALAEHIMEVDDPDVLYPDHERQLAPIGTKPPPDIHKPDGQDDDAQTTLNPNAKSFKSLFSGTSRRDRGKNAVDKNMYPIASAGNTPNLRQMDDDDVSPTNSRKSRDTRSVATTESSLAESGRNSTDLVLTPSYATSTDAPSPLIGSLGSTGKESLMAKITRKSSSSKFSLPTFKRDKSRLLVDPGSSPSALASPSTPTGPTEDDEDRLSASLSSLHDGSNPKEQSREKDSRSSTRSWSSVLKLSKKKGGGQTPSVSGLSVASGAEDGEGIEDSSEI